VAFNVKRVTDDRLITTREAAGLLGISPSTMAGYARRGVLRPAVRLPSGQLRWRIDDVRRQLDELEKEAREGED
jgi:predicted site-specific integrase-resolvase